MLEDKGASLFYGRVARTGPTGNALVYKKVLDVHAPFCCLVMSFAPRPDASIAFEQLNPTISSGVFSVDLGG